jgi:uncharacterized protein (TIGR02391 family)
VVADVELEPRRARQTGHVADEGLELSGVERDALTVLQDDQDRAVVARERLDSLQAGVEAAVGEIAGQVDDDPDPLADHAVEQGEGGGELDWAQQVHAPQRSVAGKFAPRSPPRGRVGALGVSTASWQLTERFAGQITVRCPRHPSWTVTASRPIPPFSAAAIEAVCRELGELVIGSQIAGLLTPLRYKEPPGAASGTKWKRLYNAVVAKQNKQSDGRPLIRLIAEIMQPIRFEDSTSFEAGRAAVNRKLLLYEYEVRSDGKVGRAKRAETVADAEQRTDALGTELRQRGVHPQVLAFCREELLKENYFHAVLEATKSVADRVRELSGLQGDGAALIDEATSLKSGRPLLAFNALETAWERSEHSGLAMLAKGLLATARNPTAHAPKVKWAVELPEALDVLTIASMLHRRLDAAIT